MTPQQKEKREIKFKFYPNKGYGKEPFIKTIDECRLPSNATTAYNIVQFAGYHGKNKTEVFNGDIVKVQGMKRKGIYTTEIVETPQGYTLARNDTYYNNDSCFLAILEVIGNIFQNPELL